MGNGTYEVGNSSDVFKILKLIYLMGSISNQEIIRISGYSKSAVSHKIKPLLDINLIEVKSVNRMKIYKTDLNKIKKIINDYSKEKDSILKGIKIPADDETLESFIMLSDSFMHLFKILKISYKLTIAKSKKYDSSKPMDNLAKAIFE